MIECILKIEDIFYPQENRQFSINLNTSLDYYLKIEAAIPEDYKDFPPGKVVIFDSDDQEILFERRFLISDSFQFDFKDLSYEENLCSTLTYNYSEYKEDWGFITFIELYKINTDMVDKLKTTFVKKKEIHEIIKRYLREDYLGALSDIGILAEYIAFAFDKKLKDKNCNDFRSAVNKLCNFKPSNKTKINYNYVGSLLWPLYYVRNQKSHAYPLIELNDRVASTIFTVFSEMIRYLSVSEIHF